MKGGMDRLALAVRQVYEERVSPLREANLLHGADDPARLR